MKKYSPKVNQRALLYVRTLDQLLRQDKEVISSGQLARMTGLTDVQIRKDISHFKKVGRPRIGYDIKTLKSVFEDYILQNTVHVALFGVGNLGSAILKYPSFRTEKIKLVAAFDKDRKKVGKIINGIPVYSVEDAKRVIPKSHAEVGVIAVPYTYSQDIADVIVACGLKGIINFSPTTVNVPEGVFVKNIDLSIEFLALFCDIRNHNALN